MRLVDVLSGAHAHSPYAEKGERKRETRAHLPCFCLGRLRCSGCCFLSRYRKLEKNQMYVILFREKKQVLLMQLNVMIRNCVFILFIRYVSLLHLLLEKKIKYKLKKREAGRGLAASFLFHPSFFSFLSFFFLYQNLLTCPGGNMYIYTWQPTFAE